MASSFSRILSLLRKERGLSQKQASTSLGISQALLSHYEKGIRECGLDFLVKAADFYRVSCDYLLGRTPDRTGAFLTTESLPDASDEVFKENLPQLNKKLIMNSLNIIFDLLMQSGSNRITNEASLFLMAAVYRILRVLHMANSKNPKDMFAVSAKMYRACADSMMQLIEAEAAQVSLSGKLDTASPGDKSVLMITPEKLVEGYPLYSTSLLNLISIVEERLKDFESFSY